MGLEDIKKIRLEKLERLKKAGVEPYPAKTGRTCGAPEALENFDEWAAGGKKIVLAGRLTALREHGGSTFGRVDDGGAKIQIYLKKDELGEKEYAFFLENFDIGDFVEVAGVLFLTKKGEKTLKVSGAKMLAKSLLPLPEKWHGLQDVEERFRKRYLDLAMNEEVKARFIARSKIINEIRNFLVENGYLEVETPILQALPGGALARPFKTRHNALDIDLYLRVAPELFLKRLLVGGFEKVFEIGRNFRNEGIDHTHNPEFTMLEGYAAYEDYEGLMIFIEKMFFRLVQKISGGESMEYKGQKINFRAPWPRLDFSEMLSRYAKIDYDKESREGLAEKAEELGLKIEKSDTKGKIADEIYKKICRQNLIQPVFLINHPLEISPLAKKSEKNPQKVQRFQVVAGGIELVNAFSELNDPIDQKERMLSQEKIREAGEAEVQRFDEDFIEALEHGMPPAAGFGVGIDRLVMLLTGVDNVKEVIFFPTMRPK